VPVLARANRAGYRTDASQPGRAETTGYDGALWDQRAAVEGWIDRDRVSGLVEAAETAGLIVLTHTVVRRRFGRRCACSVDVTRHAGQTCTRFGVQPRGGEVRFQYAVCHPAAVNAVLTAVQVTIAAPGYGPDETVWTVLDHWATAG